MGEISGVSFTSSVRTKPLIGIGVARIFVAGGALYFYLKSSF